MPTISVIVPVYNTEAYLSRCVDSILNQSFTDFQLLLIDDGSTDASSSICDEYAAKDVRVHAIHQSNAGVSSARNAGLDYAFLKSEAKYLTFIDSDDYVAPTYLAALYQVLLDYNADISVCGEYTHTHTQDGQKSSLDGQKNFDGIIRHSATEACRMIYTGGVGHAPFVTVWGKLYKKEIFENIRFPVGKIHEDQAVIFRALYAAECIAETGECLYAYVQSDDSIMRKQFSVKRYDDIEALDQAIAFFEDHCETALVDAAAQRQRSLLAKYSIMARAAGIYTNIPKEYKLSFFKAERTLYAIHGEDYADYFLFKYYPNYIRAKALIRRIIRGRRESYE